MAVDDIRIKLSFKGSRKRFRLRRQAGPDAVIALIDLWIETAAQFPLGTLYDCTVEDVEHMAGWAGEPGAFVAAAVDAGFLVQKSDEEWELNDWTEHQAYVVHAPERSESARNAAIARWESRRHKVSMRSACAPHTNSNAPTPAPTPAPAPNPNPNTESNDAPPSDAVRTEWNRLCARSGLQRVATWTPDRSRALSARWKYEWFRECWKDIFAKCHESTWCRENKQGIEHVLRPKNALKYYEALSSTTKQLKKEEGFSIRVSYSDHRSPEVLWIRNEKELEETIRISSLKPVLDESGAVVVIEGKRCYIKEVEE